MLVQHLVDRDVQGRDADVDGGGCGLGDVGRHRLGAGDEAQRALKGEG